MDIAVDSHLPPLIVLLFLAEWTIVQITSQYNVKESLERTKDKMHTSPLYISVFKCGKNQPPPYIIHIGVPKDVSGTPFPIRQEIYDILQFHKEILLKKNISFEKVAEQSDRLKVRDFFLFADCSLDTIVFCFQLFVEQIQNKWLGYFRFLFVGKLVNIELEEIVNSELKRILNDEDWLVYVCSDDCFESVAYCFSQDISAANFELLKGALKVGVQRHQQDLKKLLVFCFPGDESKKLRERLLIAIEKFDKKHRLAEETRNPVILIIDEVWNH